MDESKTRRARGVGARIAAGYGVLLGLIAALGIMAAIAVDQAATPTGELHRHPFAVTNTLADVRRTANAINQRIIEALAFPEQAAAISWARDFAEPERTIEQGVRLASERYLGPRQDADDLRRHWTEWRDIARRIVDDIAAGDMAAARTLYRGPGTAEFGDIIEASFTMRDFAQGRAETFVRESAAAAERLRWLLLVTLALALAVGAVVGIAVTRAITRPLAGLGRAMGAIAKGDLEVVVGETTRRDEIGAMARALSGLQQALVEKRRTELKYATVFRTCPDVIAVTTRGEGVFLEVNDAFERVLGFNKTELLGRSSLEVGTWENPEERARMVAALGVAGRLENFETRLRRRDGEVFTSLLSIEQADLDGRACLIIVGRDISDRKHEEEMLRRTAAELGRSNIELERFAHIAAHDLQEPSRTICSYAQLIDRRYGTQIDEDGRELLRYLVGGAQRMRDLVHDLLSYCRAGTRATLFSPVALDEVVSAAIADLGAAISVSGARVDIARPLPVVHGDAAQLHQLFANLIGNAIKFRTDHRPPEVAISVAPDGDAWRCTVRDNGIGIPADAAASVFDLFRRLHPADRYPGTGVGLALAKRIVEAHQGRIWIKSAVSEGTAVCFTLPRRG